ncbi:ABC transporter permease subunit [Rhizobium oryzihabitans]|uniref:ABC transporter permease subunit n=1 Tax=Rhizobium oryzihabitans TaxID=2267833 RepID=UPI001FEB8229|nr:hypothetical protein [Rhizobium oryzihabitans]
MENLVQSLVDAISMGSLFALMALGIGLVFGIMRLVNFAHGELVMIGGYGLLLLSGAPDAIAAVLVIALVVLVALVMERCAFRPLRQRSTPTLLIGSFTVSFLLQNLVLMTIAPRLAASISDRHCCRASASARSLYLTYRSS